MAQAIFDKNLFAAKHANVKDSGGYPDITKGTYVATLRKCHTRYTKEYGKLQSNFQWQIDSDSPNFPNQYIFYAFTLSDENGNNQDGGYQALASKLASLKVEFSPTDELDTILERAIGTKARLDWQPAEEEGHFPKLYVKRLISKPDGTEIVEGYKSQDVSAPETQQEQGENIVLAIGMIIKLEGTGEELEIVEMLEASEAESGVDSVMAKTPGGKLTSAKQVPTSMICDARVNPPVGVSEESPKVGQLQSASGAAIAPVTTTAINPNELDAMPATPSEIMIGEPTEEVIEEEEIIEEESDAFPQGSRASGISARSNKPVNGVIGINPTPDDGMIFIVDGKIGYRCKPETVKLS